LNIGFAEAMKKDNWDCFFFHDVDLYPEDYRSIFKDIFKNISLKDQLRGII